VASAPRALALLEHNFCRLDHNGHFVTLFEGKLLGAPSCDHAFDLALADADDNVSHDVSQRNFNYFSFELIPGGYRHTSSMARIEPKGPVRINNC